MKITRRQLRQIINEAIDVINASTGEVLVFADEGDPTAANYKPTAPEAAARDTIQRLGLNPLEGYSDGVQDAEEEIWLSAEDYAAMDYEIGGKRHKRKAKKEAERLNIDSLLQRLSDWAQMAGADYMADNQEFPDTHLQDVAWDLASAAKYEFAQDEWDELVWHFDGNEDHVIEYAAESMG